MRIVMDTITTTMEVTKILRKKVVYLKEDKKEK